ncbi:unnamed protein product [Fraxinus pennsylvanica]|uniref:Uncharacterized protein n=1 Tax=Fraxinus pennsylvanica TaxID=56036 RepID=A0AAD1YN13_9LAMI|nr:unnamed protein product [Fraxinus pennsylvanica]
MMEKWRVTYRLLKYSSNFDRQSNYSFTSGVRYIYGRSYIPFYKEFQGNANGASGSFPRVNGNSYAVQLRYLASGASTTQRNPDFSQINIDDISYFKKILGERGVVQDEEKLDDANTDWMRKHKGSSKLMLQPRTTEEVGVFLPCFT